MTDHEKLSRLVGAVFAKSLRDGHQHHRSCIHNLTPEKQVEMRGRTVESWLAVHGTMPVQITPSEWTSKPPFDESALREALK
jgi:hypothetical protein